jgi:hypothetical protein
VLLESELDIPQTHLSSSLFRHKNTFLRMTLFFFSENCLFVLHHSAVWLLLAVLSGSGQVVDRPKHSGFW